MYTYRLNNLLVYADPIAMDEIPKQAVDLLSGVVTEGCSNGNPTRKAKVTGKIGFTDENCKRACR